MEHIELRMVLDSPIQVPGDLAEIYVLGYPGGTSAFDIEVVDHKGVITRTTIDLDPHPGKPLYTVFELHVPKIPGRYSVFLRRNGVVVDKVEYIVIGERDISLDRYIAFTWHNHQAPNILPSGVYKYPWAFKHLVEDELRPYGKGPYHYHAVLLEKYRNYKCTYNLSPSLLYAWNELIEKGISLSDGIRLEKWSEEAALAKKTLDIYREIAMSNRIDVLTSMYAHSIAGYLIEYLGADRLVRDEFEYGMELTKKIIGIEPRGAWTPEMAFHMKLVDIYSELGLEYTVLDEKCHFTRSTGEKGSILEPYRVRGVEGEITVFFRHTDLSNYLSFRTDFIDEINAWKKAYEFTKLIAETLRHGGVLTIALDGENWMIFSRNPPLTAFFYDRLLYHISRIEDKEYLYTKTLRWLVDNTSNVKTLREIPTTSWLCGFRKWNGERTEHIKYWSRVRELYRALEKTLTTRGFDIGIQRAWRAMRHALDSDYWWAEFWDGELINEWLNEVEKEIKAVN